MRLGTSKKATRARLFFPHLKSQIFPVFPSSICGARGLDLKWGMSSVAILGASSDQRKFGNKALRAYQRGGYTVYPINPREDEIEGVAALKSIAEVPVRPDIVTAYLPPAVLLGILPEIAAKGCDQLWLNPGADSPEVVAEAKRLGLNVIQACSIVGLGIRPSAL